MLVKYKTAALLMVVVMACATAALAVPAQINKLELSRDGSFTVLTIQGDHEVKFAHQSVEAKEGKPFRIVIDCLAARHSLSRKAFDDLPRSIIQSIRTSQYSVDPEEVVRVVMDLNEESVYRVEAGQNCVKVYVSDQKTAPFDHWSSHPDKSVPAKIAQKPATANSKLKTAPAPPKEKEVTTVAQATPTQPAAPSVARKPSVVKQRESKTKNTSPYVAKLTPLNTNAKFGPLATTQPKSQSEVKSTPAKPTTETVSDKPMAQKTETPKAPAEKTKPSMTVASKTQTPATPTTTKPADKPSQPVAHKKQEIKKDLVGDTIAKAKAFASLDAQSSQVLDPGMNTAKAKSESKDVHKETPAPSTKTKTGEPKSNVTKPEASKPTPSAPSPVKEDKNPVLASVDKADQKPASPGSTNDEKVDKIKTSKYRRESAKSAELKSAQVVQFPQRMVIKYRQGGPRDPFESLISPDKKKKGNVDLNSVPNVETLNLVGILEPESGKGAALMEDLDGIGYILRPGDRVRNGYVAQIDKTAIYFQINEYGWGRTVVKHMEKEN